MIRRKTGHTDGAAVVQNRNRFHSIRREAIWPKQKSQNHKERFHGTSCEMSWLRVLIPNLWDAVLNWHDESLSNTPRLVIDERTPL